MSEVYLRDMSTPAAQIPRFDDWLKSQPLPDQIAHAEGEVQRNQNHVNQVGNQIDTAITTAQRRRGVPKFDDWVSQQRQPSSQQLLPPTPRSLTGTTVKPMRRRATTETIDAGAGYSQPSGLLNQPLGLVKSLNAQPFPTDPQQQAYRAQAAANRSAIREQVQRERHPSTLTGKLGRGLETATQVGNIVRTGQLPDMLRPEEDVINEQVERRLAAQERANTPEMINARKKFGQLDPITRAASSIPATLYSDVLKSGAGAIESADVLSGGMASQLGRMVGVDANQVKDYLNAKGNLFKEAQSLPPLSPEGEEIQRRLPEKLASTMGEMGVGIGELILLKKATGLSMAKIMGLETAAKTSDLPVHERAARVGESIVMGKVLDGHLSRTSSAALFGAPTAVQTGTEVLKGNMSPLEAGLQTGLQAGTGAILGGGKPQQPRGETLTKVPEIGKVLAEREARVAPIAQPKDARINDALARELQRTGVVGEPTSEVITEPTTPTEPSHYSNRQPRRQRGDGKGQFKRGKPEPLVGGQPTEVIPPSAPTERRTATRMPQADFLDLTPEEQAQIRRELAEEMGPATHEEGRPLVPPIAGLGQVFTKQEMIDRGAGGHLSKAKLLNIPIDEIDGLEPVPAMEGGYKKGTPITQPIEVEYDADQGKYMLYAGNHRVTQAKINGESTIPAFVENYHKIPTAREPSVRSIEPSPVRPTKPSVPEQAEQTRLPPTTGIAARVETARREAMGQPLPARGQGITSAESVEHGRELLDQGRDPDSVVRSFKTTGAISADAMALVRAKHEQLARAANKAFDDGGQKLDDPAFQAAEQGRRDWWEKSVKPMQTEWHKTGMAQQGETAIDTGTYYGLVRAFHDAHGKEMTSAQATEAKQLASSVAKVDKTVADTTKAINNELGGQSEAPPSRRSTPRTPRLEQVDVYFDSLAKDAKARIEARAEKAQAELKGSRGQRGAAVNPAAVGADIADYAIIGAAKLAKGGVNFARWSADMVREFGDDIKPHLANVFAESQRLVRNKKAEVKVDDAVAELRGRVDKGEKLTPQDNRTIWQHTSKYIDRGMDFPSARNAAATDLGISSEQVMRAITSQPKVKRLTDQLYRQMSDRRSARAQAEAWVRSADTPAYRKFITNLPSFFFGLKTFGHGTVGMITHAGKNIFLPTRWADYWPNFARQYRLAYDRGYHERMMQDLTNRPNYITAKRAGLANDPHRAFDDYQKQSLAKLFGKAGLIGSRGFDSLKLLRQDLFDRQWDKLADSLKTPEMAQLLAAEVNHSTGVTKMQLPKAASTVFFAPSLEGSRWAWVIGDNAKALKTFAEWKRATPEQKYYAKLVTKRNAEFVATYAALLAANQGLLIATGSKDRVNLTDPKKGDWLRFKVGGRAIEPTGGIISMVDFLGKIASASVGEKKPQESRFETVGKAAMNYGRGKLSPFAGTATDIAVQSDYSGRPLPWSSDKGTQFKPPYTWGEYFLTQQTPISVGEAARDVYHTLAEQGVPDDLTKAILKGAAIGTLSGGTGVRIGEEYQQREQQERPTRPTRQAQPRPTRTALQRLGVFH